MCLSDVPPGSVVKVAVIERRKENLKYIDCGVTPGKWMQVICHHPNKNPVLTEVELENSSCVSIPARLSRKILVDVANFSYFNSSN